MDSELRELEEELGRVAPNALPEGLISRMEAAMDGWQENEREEKVVPFPAQGPGAGSGRGGWWRAVAAVAILGAAAALMVPEGILSRPPALATTTPVANTVSNWSGEAVAPVAFQPLSAERDVVRAEKQGVVIMSGNTPHQCVRVEYLDRFEFEGEDGQELHVRKPSVGYILIPVSPD